ncbi:tRNA (guanosine(46)-N7)-methyltransferase TrmB [Candidatus Chrysopegis kryptomonas]|uniref:tRNA (guanine-N(7)-)-methyltransferase n=1 Tax=Candidatus Chryseopegocella kryptomonas TaxID=1633643 RepID=A0A0P1MTJ9_9BACT|nr:tRNA (guanosine(46)-N7)-methyltransferase TrmB [Candidatus Chrysopegis kryptomonas]CUS99081.1 tRNA (guanine-N(7)-)-methyltransferase [Candidatus Chrysopegis kryptomonas]
MDTFIVSWKNSTFPLNLDLLFGRNSQVELEIGFGNGIFLVQIASDNLDKNFVGIEIVNFFAKKADKKLKKAGLDNVRLFVGDAKLLLLILFDDKSFDHIYFNFPDPWFKKRHKKRRLLKLNFNRLLAKRLKDGGFVSVTTDHPEFRDFVVESMIDSGVFESVYPDGFTTQNPGYYPTKYEQKWRSQGKEIYYMKFRKIYHPLVFDINEYLTEENLWYVVYSKGLDRVIKKFQSL